MTKLTELDQDWRVINLTRDNETVNVQYELDAEKADVEYSTGHEETVLVADLQSFVNKLESEGWDVEVEDYDEPEPYNCYTPGAGWSVI